MTTAIRGFADRAEWLATRRQGIGASESATILGLNPYQSPAELYLRKLGEMPESEESWPMRFGTHLEDLLAREYEARHGVTLETQVFVKHPDHPWMFATLDGLTADGVVVEIKTANWRARDWGEPDTDEVPRHYLIQAQHQLEVSGRDVAHVWVSISGAEPVRYVILRNRPLGRAIVEACREFWQHVCDRKPPRNLLRPDDHKLMHLIYPEACGEIGLGPEVGMMVDRRSEIAGQIKALQGEDARLKTQILAEIGPFEGALLPDGRAIRRKTITVPAQTIERREYTYTDLRVRKADA